MKLIYKILLVFMGCIGIVAALYLMQEKPPVKNGFKRGKIRPVLFMGEINLKYNSWFLNGLSNSRIFLGNYAAPAVLFSCGYDLKDTLTQRLPFTYNKAINWDLAKIQVDSPNVYLSEHDSPSFISAVLPFANERTHLVEGLHCDAVFPLSAGSFIVNGSYLALGGKALRKIEVNRDVDSAAVYEHPVQPTGSFSVDGFLRYNKEQAKLIFTYYYRNTFVCLDTNLNVLYTGKLIDTNHTAKIKLMEYKADGKTVRSFGEPPVVVNKRGYSDGDFIYNESALAADDEDRSRFDKPPYVIDVYFVKDGRYSHSFYLPGHRDGKLTGFAVRGDKLVALYGQYLVVYRLTGKEVRQTG